MRDRINLWLLNVRIAMGHRHDATMEAISPILSFFYWPGLLLSLFYCAYWIWHLPSAGIAVGALGAVGVFVALKGEKIPPGHRVIWAFVTVVFLFTEVRAIKDQDEKHAQTMKQIVDSYKEAKAENQAHFDTTLEKLDTHTSRLEILSKSQESIAKLSNENLLQITGEKAFCYFWPSGAENSAGLPLQVWGSQYTAYGVRIEIIQWPTDNKSPEAIIRAGHNPILVKEIGDVNGKSGGHHIGYNLPVQRGKNNRYQINISSKAAKFTEHLVGTMNDGISASHWAETEE